MKDEGWKMKNGGIKIILIIFKDSHVFIFIELD